jgi:hypothetical protein
MPIKSVLPAVLLTAGSMLFATPAHASPTCTALGNSSDPATRYKYMDCTREQGAFCHWLGAGGYGGLLGGSTNMTCTYPDGGHDECNLTTGPGLGEQLQNPINAHCDYFPPGS